MNTPWAAPPCKARLTRFAGRPPWLSTVDVPFIRSTHFSGLADGSRMIFLLWVAPVALSIGGFPAWSVSGAGGMAVVMPSDAVTVFNEANIVLAGTLVDASDRG